MENPTLLSTILGIAGVVLGYPAVRYLWPVIRDSLSAQGSQWRSENKYIAQLQLDLQAVKDERDVARKEANQLFVQVAKLEAQMQIMTARLEAADAKIEELSAAIKGSSQLKRND